MPNKPILLAEDDDTLGELLKSFLELNGFEVKLYRDPEQALRFFSMREFDLCILDVMMPGKDGFTLAREIRKIRPSQPFLFLTARKMKEDMIRGYEVGADDYIVKPFDSDLLLKKIQVIMRRKSGSTLREDTKTAYHFGRMEYRPETRELLSATSSRKLSPKEGELLLLLCQKLGAVMLRSEALQQIWGEENFFTNKTMDVYLARLRKYLEEDNQVKIENVHSKGFRLIVAS